jgi:hypothetical protein
MSENYFPPSPPEAILEDMKKIPENIKTKIYNEYFKHDLKYEKIVTLLKNENSMTLNSIDLINYFKKNDLLNNYSFIEYLKKKDSIFKKIYNDHETINTFILMNKLDSMCQCWLMYLYH